MVRSAQGKVRVEENSYLQTQESNVGFMFGLVMPTFLWAL